MNESAWVQSGRVVGEAQESRGSWGATMRVPTRLAEHPQAATVIDPFHVVDLAADKLVVPAADPADRAWAPRPQG